jgi:hypothetical protein
MVQATCPQCSADLPKRASSCPSCGAVLREALPPQTSGMMDVFALPISIAVGLVGALLLSELPGDSGSPLLRVGLGVTGLLVPPLVGMVIANRGRVRRGEP